MATGRETAKARESKMKFDADRVGICASPQYRGIINRLGEICLSQFHVSRMISMKQHGK